jgi:hypothetical protein
MNHKSPRTLATTQAGEAEKQAEEDRWNYQERLTWNIGDHCELMIADPTTGELKPYTGPMPARKKKKATDEDLL